MLFLRQAKRISCSVGKETRGAASAVFTSSTSNIHCRHNSSSNGSSSSGTSGSSNNHAAKSTAPPAPGNPFHLAIPVHSIPEARKFYGGILGLKEGRRAGDKWQDYSLYGHQVVCHYVGESYRCNDYYNPVDGDEGGYS